MACTPTPVAPPKVVAIATDTTVVQSNPSIDPSLPVPAPKYGQDFLYGNGRAAPGGRSVGKTPAELKPKMEKLVKLFASKDTTGMAQRLFDLFLQKQSTIYYFDDRDLNAKAAAHPNIQYFCDAAMGGPSRPPGPGKTRIHQALRAANWDINKLVAPTDLGVPAFNNGSSWSGSEDWGNGLKVMINGVQFVYVIATHYCLEPAGGQYTIKLKYIFYDVFGLDDTDLERFGINPYSPFHSDEAIGITAWWQLQHQHGYAPLVTRIIVEKEYTLAAL